MKNEDKENLRKKLQFYIDSQFTRKEAAEDMKTTHEQITVLMSRFNLKPDFRHVMTKRAEKKVIDEYEKNPLSIKEMRLKLSLTDTIVRKIYNRHGLKKIRDRNNSKLLVLTAKDFNEILVELKTTRMSLAKIAERHNVSRQRIYQIQVKNNIKRF